MNYAGKNLKYLISKLNLSQISIEPVVGKRQQTISNWLSEKSQMDTEDLVNLSDFFGIALDDFCLTDLSQGNLINDNYLAKFKVKGNLKGNAIGNLMTQIHQKIGEPTLGREVQNNEEESGLWVVISLLRQMDQKLDQIRAAQELAAKK